MLKNNVEILKNLKFLSISHNTKGLRFKLFSNIS